MIICSTKAFINTFNTISHKKQTFFQTNTGSATKIWEKSLRGKCKLKISDKAAQQQVTPLQKYLEK